MTRFEYRGFYIPKDDDWQPEDLADFGFEMDFYVGSQEGADAFTVTVCSPSWFAREMGREIVAGRDIVFMPRFDRASLDEFLREKVQSVEGKSAEAAMLKIDGLGRWEYAYRS